MPTLRDKTISGIFWSFLQKVGSKGITFVVMILLARLLTPEDFGLIGMLMIFIQVSEAIVNGGFNLALIQKKDTDEEDYSSVFYINLVIGILLYIILFLTAPLIANFYDQPILTSLVRVLSLVFFINAFSIVQEARLTKLVRFKTLMIIHIPSTIIGGIVSIVMALLGFGVWSIVAMQIVTRFAYAVQIWIHAKWKPLFLFNKERAKKLFSFGSKLFIARIIGTIYNNIFLVVIGKFFPLSSVGYYQNAFNLASVPSMTISSVVSTVTFPIFSSIQDDDRKLKNGYRRSMQQTFFWICPLYILAAVLAEPLFRFIFTEKWLPAVPYFQWLCVVAILQPLYNYNLNIVNVKGRSDIFLNLQLIRRGVTSVGIVLAVIFGNIMTLLIVQATSAVFTYFIFSYYSGKFIDYSIKEQLKDILSVFLLSTGIGLIIFIIDNGLTDLLFSDFIRLFVGFGVGVILLLILSHFFKIPPFIDIQTIFKQKILTKIQKIFNNGFP